MQPAGEPLEGPRRVVPLASAMSRRTFLKRLGIGAGAVTIVVGGGIAWRAADQRVLAPGTGPAYDAWRTRLTGDGPLSLVRAALLAASAHDTQPWRFRIAGDRLDLFADRSRTIGTMDPLGRELELSLGCALENLLLAAPANGYRPVLTLLPDATEPDHVARVELVAENVPVSVLFAAIPQRHTDRSAYDASRGVERAALEGLTALSDDPRTALLWLDAASAKTRFAELTVEATAAIVADPEQAHDDFAWYRQEWAEIERRKDGITMDTAGLPEPMRLAVRILPPTDRATMQQGWLDATRDRHVATASAFGLITIEDRSDLGQRIAAGRLFQRLHLAATTQSLAIQPLNQVLERVDREIATGVEPRFSGAIEEWVSVDRQVVLAFRVGHPTSTPNLSPRRPAEDVLLS